LLSADAHWSNLWNKHNKSVADHELRSDAHNWCRAHHSAVLATPERFACIDMADVMFDGVCLARYRGIWGTCGAPSDWHFHQE
jgi:hypothetical protein